MLNVNEHIFKELNQNEFWMLCQLARFGANIFPSNDTIMKRVGWRKGKLDIVKKGLVKRGFLFVQTRFKFDKNGKSVRDSNEYILKRDTITKYIGATKNKKHVKELTAALESAKDKINEQSEEISELKRIIIELRNKLSSQEKTEEKQKPTTQPNQLHSDILEICHYFADLTSKKIRFGTDAVEKQKKRYKYLKTALTKKGATVEDCKKIISLKFNSWKDNHRMSGQINIDAMFNGRVIDRNLDQIENEKTATVSDSFKLNYKEPKGLNENELSNWYKLRLVHHQQNNLDSCEHKIIIEFNRLKRSHKFKAACHLIESNYPQFNTPINEQ